MRCVNPWVAGALVCAAATLFAEPAAASSHRDAPAITADPYADNTDVYAFLAGPAGAEELVILGNYMPLLIPGSGPNFWRFADDVIYGCHVDNNGDANVDVSFYFDFETEFTNPDSFLYNVGPITAPNDTTQQHRTTYDVIRLDWTYDSSGYLIDIDYDTLARDLDQAPWYVGQSTFPTDADYDAAADAAIASVPGEGMFFAGPRREYFYVDLEQTFDLLSYDATATNTTSDFNVMTLAMQLPLDRVGYNGERPDSVGDVQGTDAVGVYCNSARRRVTIRGGSRDEFSAIDLGHFVQVSRLGLPLISEVVVGVGTKDKFMRTAPGQDVDTIGGFVLDPELPVLFEALFGVECQDAPRNDLLALISPYGTQPADLLRLDIREGQTAADSGMPNGRTLLDDALDVMASAACDATAIPFNVPLGDGVDASDLPPPLATFPYLPRPLSGNP
ncbi:MAG: DUF4331 domain-containing protein [Myxococcales bacterium]|nr:DUF4331 domain-containing protein [Myxococcales bacterium]